MRRTGRPVPTLLACGLAGLLLLSACGGPAPTTGGGTTTASAGTTAEATTAAPTTAAAGGSCNGWTAGQDGVIRTFCDGPARATVTVGTKATQLTGGQCEVAQNLWVFNLGVVTGSDFPAGKPRPDYVGVIMPDTGGEASTFVVVLDGKPDLVLNAKGSVSADKKTVKVSGKSTANAQVTVDVTCG